MPSALYPLFSLDYFYNIRNHERGGLLLIARQSVAGCIKFFFDMILMNTKRDKLHPLRRKSFPYFFPLEEFFSFTAFYSNFQKPCIFNTLLTPIYGNLHGIYNSNPSPAANKKPCNLKGYRAFFISKCSVFPLFFPFTDLFSLIWRQYSVYIAAFGRRFRPSFSPIHDHIRPR